MRGTTPSHCNACGGALRTRFRVVVDPQTREHFSIAACERCGLGHTTPQPEDLQPYYGSTYHGGRHGFTARYCVRRRLRLVTAVAGLGAGRRLLDVGCGDGAFLLGARAGGWRVTGTEMSPQLARAAGLDVRETIDDAQEAHAPFDCITLWHSLEHMRDPQATLKSLAKLLAPEGFLFVAVPDAEGLQARVFGSGWFHLDVPRHLYHFGATSLGSLLDAAGFAIVRRWHQEFEYDLFGWSQSALNRLMPVPNLFFNHLTGRHAEAGTGQLAATYLAGAAFSALALPATAIGTLSRRGGTLIVAARHQRESAPPANAGVNSPRKIIVDLPGRFTYKHPALTSLIWHSIPSAVSANRRRGENEMFREFREFINRGNVVDLAVAVVIGAAFGKIITSLVEGIIMPPIGLLLGKVDFASLFYVLDASKGQPLSLADAKAKGIPVIAYGSFLNDLIGFLIIAFVVFLIVRQVNRMKSKQDTGTVTTKDCPQCLSTIPLKALRCAHCTIELQG